MALNKVNYVDNQTVITAQNLNNIQNEIIQNTELIKKAAPRNLLDNSDFRNPVNQLGITTFTGSGYTIDRWLTRESTTATTIDSNGITISGSGGRLRQYLEKTVIDTTKTYTLAAMDSNGRLDVRYGKLSQTPGTDMVWAGVTGEGLPYFALATGHTYVWAALYEGEYTAETLPRYQPKGYMVEALNCGALHVTTTATLDEGQWSNSAPFEQSIVIPGIIESDVPHITPVYSTANTTAIAQKEAWACVSNAIAENGVIRFICFEDKPTTTIPIQIEVNR